MKGAPISENSRGSFVFLTAGPCGRTTAFGQKPDPFIGIWLIDSKKWGFIPGPGPGNRQTTISAIHNGLRTAVPEVGGLFDEKTDSVILFNSMDYPVDPVLAADTYSIKRINANAIERTGNIRGDSAETVAFVVSADSKTFTVKTKGTIKGSD